MKYNRYYTEEEHITVKQFAGKKTAEEIGLMIGRTRNSVLNYASKNKITLRQTGQYHCRARLTDMQAQMVGALFDAGFSNVEINKACFPHVSRGCITGITTGANR